MTPSMTNYRNLWNSCQVLPGAQEQADAIANLINQNKRRYQAITDATKVPWIFVGIVHHLEADLSFGSHLCNGDPLVSRTIHVPRGRPVAGSPPFTWEESAIDTMKLLGLDKVLSWNLPEQMLYRVEGYNGFGYCRYGINSPYLWAGTNHYSSGKFTDDGIFSPNAVSKQIGAVPVLRSLIGIVKA